VSREKELEERLLQHRGAQDRSGLLEDRVQTNRAERPSQQQREQRLDETHLRGRDHIYWDFAERNQTAAFRYDDLGLIELLEQKKAAPAVAMMTNIPSLDYALGGIVSGVMEIYGPEGVGKTSLLIDLLRFAQGDGLEVAICPTEFFDTPYFDRRGVDLDELVVIRSVYSERTLELAGEFITSRDRRALFIDSGTGLRPKNDEYDNWARMMLSWLSHVAPQIGQNSCIIMTDQVRARRSVDPSKFFAGGTDSTARRIAGIFDQRLELSREEVSENKYQLVINIVANTIKPPARYVQLPFVKGDGIDWWRDVVKAAEKVGVLNKNGSWYYFGDYRLGQGEDQAARRLEQETMMDSDALVREIFELTYLRLRLS